MSCEIKAKIHQKVICEIQLRQTDTRLSQMCFLECGRKQWNAILIRRSYFVQPITQPQLSAILAHEDCFDMM